MHQPGGWLDSFAYLLRVRGVDVGKPNAVMSNNLVKQPRSSSVDIGAADHMVAGLEHGDQGRNGSHAA